ncbi:branched-chain amino acid ABC transporter permease [Mycobacterium sp. CBMA293]|uniref:AzlC family ABC transporter permease n=1 Tax=unclassified Mycolicibacterium TaxID=2636767 RepID=UPI0012DD223C|nr:MULTISPECIES: AzlC family ABC transporter permease [unclassified Mycolicibacterium]MUL45837.1 branched-chain amino acid ABC transporter permease [Mycolicibacterium sp. CBMA 360]MUL60509.1 branched-chain amino acid ABC transporter permease [Mycolicibacterium sp. CBMA 335]MUL72324.1 branched-chain amino acid ABC transporter permease [Mycolicibacterium sp. CBMA 311]MUL95275.1 branched-chain amino acid ABC transporter permease [Mycolicibacterium sp. CBMA 230]MUM06905.1 branched-chain amino acid
MDALVVTSRRAEVAAGVRASLAAGLGMYPIGVAFGLLVIQAGLPWWVAPALSIACFAGSLELLLIGMIVAATPLATIALTAFLVNFRHIFYAFTFPLHVVRNRFARAYSVYTLVDEAYAVTAANPRGWTSWRLVSLQAAFQCYWVGGGLTGVLLGSMLPTRIEGLEFALCALFVTLTLDACRSRAGVPSLLLAAVSFSIAMVVAPHQALFVGLLLFIATLVVRYVLVRRQAPANA